MHLGRHASRGTGRGKKMVTARPYGRGTYLVRPQGRVCMSVVRRAFTLRGFWKRGLVVAALVSGSIVGVSAPAWAVTCPQSGYFCLYEANGFNYDDEASNVSVSFATYYYNGTWLTPTIQGELSSIRNRMNCSLRMFKSYNYTGTYVTVAANTEVSQIGTTYGSSWNDTVESIQVVC